MNKYMKPIPSYEKGGDVPKDQVANVDEGERVLNPNEAHAYRMAEMGKAPSNVLGRIAERAHELYSQWKGLSAPEDTEAEAFKEKEKMVEGLKPLPLSPAKEMEPMKENLQPAGTSMRPLGARYGTRPGEKRLDFQGNEIQPTTPEGMRALGPQMPVPQALKTLPSYDEGGDVPEDQTAEVHKDEKVLDPQKAEAYRQAEAEVTGEGTPKQEASLVPDKTVNPLGDTGAPRPTGMRPLPMQTGPKPLEVTSEEKRPAPPDPMAVVQADKLAAMTKGTTGLTDLGTALIHERTLGGKKEEPEPTPESAELSKMSAATAPTPEVPAYTGMKRIGAGTPGEAEAHRQFEEKRQDYDKRIQAAMDLGTPEGDREAASLQLAKMHFEKMNPLGSAANKPGALGKIEHGLAKVGNIAGDIVAPRTMATIPGTDLYKRGKEQELRGQEQEATKESLEQAQARVAGAKTVPEQVYNWAMRGNNGQPQINPDTGKPFTPAEAQVLSTGTGKTPVQVLANELQHQVNPDTNQKYTPVEALEEAMKVQAGTKLNERQRRVADYVAAHHMEDTPENREKARIAIEKADTEAKQESTLPFAEAKAKFNDKLTTARALLVQQNADANARGLKADELQNTENARSSAVMSKLQSAKDALSLSDEDQFAAQIAPITTLLAATSAAGVKRVNKQELDKFVPASGSFGRWIDAHAEQFLDGKIPKEYRAEVGHMLDRWTAAETAEHIINTRSIDETIRQGAQTPVQRPTGGAAPTPKASEPKAPAEEKKTTPAAAGGESGFAKWKKEQKK